MARRAPFGSFHEDPPAEIREHAPLFDWARAQAAAIAETREKLVDKRLELETISLVVEESGEFGEVEEAKERLKKAKQDALDCSPVQTATEALRKARKALKKVAATKKLRTIKKEVDVLRIVIDETKDRLASGLAAGKVPQTVADVIDEAVDGAMGKGKRAS